MGRPSLTAIIGSLPDSEVAVIIRRIWEARGYDAEIHFSGPDIHVRASGETSEGARRNVRVWVATDGELSAWQTRGYVRQCEQADEEAYVAVVGDARVAEDAHRSGLIERNTAAIVVRVREAGIESFVYGRRDDDPADDQITRNWLGDPIDEEGDGDADSAADGAEAEASDDPELGRRAAIKQGGKYVVGGFLTYLGVGWLTDYVQQSPTARAAIQRRAAWVDARLPDVRPPEAGEEGTTTATPTADGAADLPGEPVEQATPPNATALALSRLRSGPDGFVGTTVRYAGEITETTERETARFVIVRVRDEGGFRGDLIGRWQTGRFFEDSVGFRLLNGTRVTVWGDVVGTSSVFIGETLPAIDVAALQRANRTPGGESQESDG
jgi:hypothetical protein